MKFIDITGHRFGKLTAISIVGNSPRKTRWMCNCDCGKSTTVPIGHLRSGHTTSCGCQKGYRLNGDENAFRMSVRAYKENAKRYKRLFTLTEIEMRKLFTAPCFYCGALPGLTQKPTSGRGLHFTRNGIDRKNNSRGYVFENCVSCCRACNFMKQDLTYETFISQVKRIWIYSTE